MTTHAVDSRYAWARLAVALLLMTIGSSAMYVVAVVLPSVQAEFGVARADASLPYTLLMIGFGVGGVFMGRLADRRGVAVPLLIGAAGLGLGFVAAALSGNVWTFALAHGVLLGLVGSSASFAPLVADTSLWFERRRGIAVAICASGNYVAGAIWPPIVQHFVESVGWRQTYLGMGVFSGVTMAALALLMRARPPVAGAAASVARPGAPVPSTRPFGLSMNAAQTLLCIAGVACCTAMAMPQVHIVAYCGDLGFGAARGAQMLSLMLACGVVSRLVSGWICDRIGGLRTLLLGSLLQGTALTALPAVRFAGLALRRLGAVRPVPGRDRAVVRDHRPRALPGRRGRRARRHDPDVHAASAWRSAAGCRARCSTSPARTTPRSSTASPGTCSTWASP